MSRHEIRARNFVLLFAMECLHVGPLTIADIAEAATLYVATTGNDSNPGTLSQPFATISRAASKASPGTNVIVRGGVYGRVWVGNSGTSASSIQISAYSGKSVVIDGTGTAAGTDVVLISGSYIQFSGFQVRDSTGIGINAWGGTNVSILNNIVHDCYEAGIVSGYSSAGVSKNNIIQGNHVYNTNLMNRVPNSNHMWGQGITATQSDSTVIRNNVVHANYGEGIGSISSNGVTISRNTVFDNYSVEIYLDNSPNVVVSANYVYFTGDTRFLLYQKNEPPVGIGAAIEAYTSRVQLPLNGASIINNIVVGGRFGFYYGNYDLGGGMQNALIANNTFVNQTDAAIHIDPDKHSSNQAVNNIFYRSPSGGVLQSGSPTGFSLGNNCWFGGTSGTFGGGGDVAADPLFVQAWSFSPDNYRISNASPCMTSGRELKQVTSNFWGTSRAVPYSSGAF